MIPQLQRETPVPVSSTDPVPQWSFPTKFGFRFAFCYFLLYIAPGAVGSLGSYKTPEALDASIWSKIWHPVVPWVGTNILRIHGDFREVPNGSGDQLYDYVLIVCLVITSILLAALWSVIDRKRPNYSELYRWLRVFMRMVAGWAMLGYGVKKLIGAQFIPPDLAHLQEPFGRATPMNMLWTFMGASQPYSFFGGLGETVGGALLMFPALTTLGAIVSGAMMTNVLMLNMFYDVPRKIFSIHLVLMCLFLLIPDYKRLANVLVLNRRAEPVNEPPLFEDKFLNRTALLAQVAFGIFILWIAGGQSVRDIHTMLARVPDQVRGVWTVKEYSVDGMLRPPLMTDSDRWQNIIFDNPKIVTITTMDGDQHPYLLELDDANKTAKLKGDKGTTAILSLTYPATDTISFDGQMNGHHVSGKLDRIDTSDPVKYPLANKGFHWINPYIDNR